MVSFPTYAVAILWACAVPVVFAVVSDKLGMCKALRLAILRGLWMLPLVLSLLTLTCGVLLLITP